MRAAAAAPVTSLLGSLGLHAGALLTLFIVLRKPIATPESARERADAWQGNAVEVDAIAVPEPTPSLSNADNSSSEHAAPAVAPPAAPISDLPSDEFAPPRPRPKPRPKPASATKPPAPSAESAPRPSRVGQDGTPALATGAFGSQGLPIGVRSLPSAFARAIPPATGADPIWQTLPVGSQPPFTLTIQIDAGGHIREAKLLESRDGRDALPQFVRLRDRVIALLGGGSFALQDNSVAGSDRFRITITLSDRALREDGEQALLVERGFEPPRGSSAGRAYFTLASGRHFEAKIEVLNGGARAKLP